MEIPKDGKSYLAWHRHEGMISVYWSDTSPEYTIGIVTYCSQPSQGYWVYASDRGPMTAEHFDRWMDEYGQWHEVRDGLDKC